MHHFILFRAPWGVALWMSYSCNRNLEMCHMWQHEDRNVLIGIISLKCCEVFIKIIDCLYRSVTSQMDLRGNSFDTNRSGGRVKWIRLNSRTSSLELTQLQACVLLDLRSLWCLHIQTNNWRCAESGLLNERTWVAWWELFSEVYLYLTGLVVSLFFKT